MCNVGIFFATLKKGAENDQTLFEPIATFKSSFQRQF